MKEVINLRALLLCLVFISNLVIAQVEVIDKDESPLEVSLGPGYISDLNPTVSQALPAYSLSFLAAGQLTAMHEQFWWLFDYSADFEKYQLEDESDLQLDEHFNALKGRVLMRAFVSDKWFVDTEIQHLIQQQLYGTGISRLRTEVLNADELTQSSAAVTLVFGADITDRFVSLKASVEDSEYANNNLYSSLFDVTKQALEFNLAFRYSSLSRLLLRMTAKNDDYGAIQRTDSELIDAQIGLEWSPSGKSELEALVGKYQRKADGSEISSGLSWLLNFTYKPVEDLSLMFRSARYSDVSGSLAEATSTVVQSADVNLNFQLSQRWGMGLNIGQSSTDFELSSDPFTLDELEVDAEISLAIKEHNAVVLTIGYEDVNTDNNSFNFEQKSVELAWRYHF